MIENKQGVIGVKSKTKLILEEMQKLFNGKVDAFEFSFSPEVSSLIENSVTRDRIVCLKSSRERDARMNLAVAGGSSRILRRAFCASSPIPDASRIINI